MRLSHYFACLVALGLAACSEKPVTTVAEKAKYTIELFIDRDDCKRFSQMLQPPVTDEKMIDKAYQAAKSAQCIKPTV